MSKPPIANKDAMVKRLARVEGQLRGVQKLIQNDEDCEKIIQQLAAARKALDKAGHEMLACIIEQEVCEAENNDQLDANMMHIRSLISKYS